MIAKVAELLLVSGTLRNVTTVLVWVMVSGTVWKIIGTD